MMDHQSTRGIFQSHKQLKKCKWGWQDAFFSICCANWQKTLDTIILRAGKCSSKWAVKLTAGQGCKLGWLFSGPFGNMFPKPLKDHLCVTVLANPWVGAQQERCPELPPNSLKAALHITYIRLWRLWITDVRIHHLPITKYWWRIKIKGATGGILWHSPCHLSPEGSWTLAELGCSSELGPVLRVRPQSLCLKFQSSKHPLPPGDPCSEHRTRTHKARDLHHSLSWVISLHHSNQINESRQERPATYVSEGQMVQKTQTCLLELILMLSPKPKPYGRGFPGWLA